MRGLLVCSLLLAACRVDSGQTPDAAPCMPSTRYFASTLWLSYLDANQCATASCHAASTGHGYLRYLPAGNPPDPNGALADWPTAWRTNYLASIQLVRCDEPLASRLLTVPEGKADPHPVGSVIENQAAAEQLFQDWISAR